jgi:hypothetical protein
MASTIHPTNDRPFATRRVDDAVFVHHDPAMVDGFGHPPYERPTVRDP